MTENNDSTFEPEINAELFDDEDLEFDDEDFDEDAFDEDELDEIFEEDDDDWEDS